MTEVEVKEKLVGLLQDGNNPVWGWFPNNATMIQLANYLIANGVTVQTTPISYERLLALAKSMHTWIFCNSGDEQKVYDEIGLTDDENYIFGYGGKIEISMPEPPKGE